MYGCTPPKLAQSLGKPVNQGKRLFNDFWQNRKPLQLLNDDLLTTYRAKGYLIGLDGRRISIREDRKLLNTLIQGASAVIFKWWMFLNQLSIRERNLQERIIQLIAYHDELQYECRFAEKGWVEQLVAGQFQANALKTGMHFKIDVPIEADFRVGKNWSQTH